MNTIMRGDLKRRYEAWSMMNRDLNMGVWRISPWFMYGALIGAPVVFLVALVASFIKGQILWGLIWTLLTLAFSASAVISVMKAVKLNRLNDLTLYMGDSVKEVLSQEGVWPSSTHDKLQEPVAVDAEPIVQSTVLTHETIETLRHESSHDTTIDDGVFIPVC